MYYRTKSSARRFDNVHAAVGSAACRTGLARAIPRAGPSVARIAMPSRPRAAIVQRWEFGKFAGLASDYKRLHLPIEWESIFPWEAGIDPLLWLILVSHRRGAFHRKNRLT
jgi:hypothetical protein